MSDTNERYIRVMLGHVNAFACKECGSLVLDSLLHTQWHEQIKVAQPLCVHDWEAVKISPDFQEYKDAHPDEVLKSRMGRRCYKCGQVDLRDQNGRFEMLREGRKAHEHLWLPFFLSPDYKDYPKTLPGAQREARKCESCGQVDIRTVDGYVTITDGVGKE